MAPLDVMPHAAHIFLEQVDHGLWNNAWFYINGPHVIQAGPQAADGDESNEPRESALRPFRELSLDSLAYPEYSAQFPHLPWTLGFTGRPGGPDFYINKVDNSVAHGPGGQHQHELEEFADPCFCRVVKGFETLEDIARVSTILEGEYQFFFEYPVHIVHAHVVKDPIHVDQDALNQRQAGFGNIELRSGESPESEKMDHVQHHFEKPKIEHQVEA